ncbi:CDP-alcohol phosphatidyltransferase family protein [Flavobacterium sp.]|uniref:CDP-alcohol phosphatidyltransferase family protein n=1 Tax=Flavobacterium sp. TaxID=239 RepID=UPI0024878065|nr:CDP-alcohol phosphatidyltransferase family protein [Flavobacterium sp.]MDI1318494.1 CDP-alcohol phosphatidyltransferase family protein [Flavobacterium sp.]
MNIKAQIPNLFTMLNLFSGCVALVMVSYSDIKSAFFFVCLGIFFDFFDGFFARKFNVAGPLGVQLDSLADMVTSGVVPGYVMFKMMLSEDVFGADSYLPYLGFIITLGACYRLAKFNIDTRQSDSFIGLPTPANALFFTSLPLVNSAFYDDNFSGVIYNKWILIGITLLSAYVMNAEIPLFSLKIKNFSVAKYKLQIFFLAASVLLFIFLQIVAVPLIIVLYVLLSVMNNFATKKASV